MITGFPALLLLFPRIVTDVVGWFGPEKVEQILTEEELLAKAAADAAALAKGIASQAAEAVTFVSFWPNQVLVSMVGLVILVAILFPQKLTARRRVKMAEL